MKVGFVSLGCPKNQLDTEVMLHEVATAGYEITPEETEADVVIINTCGFIESAKQEAIENILDIAWLKKFAARFEKQTDSLAKLEKYEVMQAKFKEKIDKIKPAARNVAIACGVALAVNALISGKKNKKD